MSYELGRILRFNNSEWGLLEYKCSRLVVYKILIPKNKLDKIKF